MQKRFITVLSHLVLTFLSTFSLQCSGDWEDLLYSEEHMYMGDWQRTRRQLDFLERFCILSEYEKWYWNHKERLDDVRMENAEVSLDRKRVLFEEIESEVDARYHKVRMGRSPIGRSPIVALIDAFNRGIGDFLAIICFSWKCDRHVDWQFRYPDMFSSYSQIGGFGSLCTYLAEAFIEKMPFIVFLALLAWFVRHLVRKRKRRHGNVTSATGKA